MDANMVQEGAAPAAAPAEPAVGQDIQNRLAEEQRKRELAEQELAFLRDQQMRAMAQSASVSSQAPVASAVEDDDDIDALDPMTRKAVEKMLARKEVHVRKIVEETSKKTFLREQYKSQAVSIYPDLRNPQSEFFKKVAFFMDTHPGKYDDPEGILDACARVGLEMGVSRAPVASKAQEQIRQSVSSASAGVEGSGNANISDTPELDPKGIALAQRLGIDPKATAQRLQDMMGGKGVYAPKEGKTGKASI